MHQELTWLLGDQERVVAAVRARGVRGDLVQDVAQEVLVGAWRSLADGRYRPPRRDADSWWRWVMSIVRHQASNERRRAHHRREHLRPDDELEALGARAETSLVVEQCILIRKVIDALKPERAAVFVACEALDMEAREAAAALAVPLSTAWSRLRLARLDAAAAGRRLAAAGRFRWA